MGSLGLRVATILPSLTAAILFVAGCSNPMEDVRITLCQDIVATQVGAAASLLGTDTEIRRPEYAAIRVRFSAHGKDAVARCYYDHVAVDDTADNISTPLSAYATSPYRVIIDGQELSRPGLAEAVKQAMLKQGREFVERAQQGIQGAIQR